MDFTPATIIGLMGPPMFLFAYAMVSLGRWQPTLVRFHLLNLLGAIAILISLTEQWNLPVCILELCWGGISVVGIIRARKAKT